MAVLLTGALFFGWTAIGLAVLNAAGLRNGTRKLLLAPALGVVPAAVLAYTGVKLGFPVRDSGVAIGFAVLLFAVATLWFTRGPRARVLVVARRQVPFAGVLVATFVLTAWPLFKFGYDWVANGNDDYANYCLGATGFREHGYTRVPEYTALRAQTDLTQPLWWLYHSDSSAFEGRAGSELTLALVSVWTGLSPQQAFMSVIAALNLALVSAATGTVLCATRRRGVALTAAALLAVSSQTTYGVVQQLIAQAGGIALLCAALSLLRAPVRHLPYRAVARRALGCGTAFAGLILFYPEAVPFLVGGAVLLGARDLVARRPVRKHLWHAAAAVAVMALALPAYLTGVTVFLLGQGAQGTGSADHTVEIFPYFMTPRGPALVSGLVPYVNALPGALHDLALVTGCAVLVALVWVAARQFARGRAPAAVLAVMLALGAFLYAKSAAFGLFKIAMFVQPFLWGALALWAAERAGWGRRAAVATLLLVAGLNAYTQGQYVRQSTGHDGRVDLPVATQQRLMREFRAALDARPVAQLDRVVFACDNSVLVKLLTAEALGPAHTQLGFASFFRLSTERRTAHNDHASLTLDLVADALPEVRDPATGERLHWLVHHPADWTRDDPNRVLFVAGVGPLSVLNRQRFPQSGPALLAAPLADVRNFLAFRDATGARHNFWGMDDASQIALARLEPDPALRHRTFAAVGSALVVEVVNPTPKVRAVVSYTSTYLPEPEARTVPNIEIVGAARVPLGGTGIGAARLVSPPLAPQRAGSGNVLVLDVNKPRVRNPNRLTGLESLWGAHLNRDRRQLTGHLREFSVVTDEEYAAFKPPERLAKLPADLGHPHAEYSGVMEDGWLGREFKVRLTCEAANRDLVVRGQVPGVDPNFRTTATVLIDGSPVLTRELPAGDFELRAPAGAGVGPKWVELRFDRTTVLPKPDGRATSALLRHIGFELAQTEGTARR